MQELKRLGYRNLVVPRRPTLTLELHGAGLGSDNARLLFGWYCVTSNDLGKAGLAELALAFYRNSASKQYIWRGII
jgi:hypothetical protein